MQAIRVIPNEFPLQGTLQDTMRVLVIEDDRDAASWLVKGLTESGHVADHAADGDEGLALAREGVHDVLIVDRMLPKRDGLSIIRTIRNEGIATPVLILSALSDVDERVKGLRAGGDDYLAKPYAFAELLARVEGLGRRKAQETQQTKLKAGELEMDLLTRTVSRAPASRSCCNRANSSFLNISCAMPGISSRAPCCLRMSGTIISIRRPMSSTCMCRACAARSTRVSTSRCCRRCAEPDI